MKPYFNKKILCGRKRHTVRTTQPSWSRLGEGRDGSELEGGEGRKGYSSPWRGKRGGKGREGREGRRGKGGVPLSWLGETGTGRGGRDTTALIGAGGRAREGFPVLAWGYLPSSSPLWTDKQTKIYSNLCGKICFRHGIMLWCSFVKSYFTNTFTLLERSSLC